MLVYLPKIHEFCWQVVLQELLNLERKRRIFVRKSIVVSHHFTYLENSIYLTAHKVFNNAP